MLKLVQKKLNHWSKRNISALGKLQYTFFKFTHYFFFWNLVLNGYSSLKKHVFFMTGMKVIKYLKKHCDKIMKKLDVE